MTLNFKYNRLCLIFVIIIFDVINVLSDYNASRYAAVSVVVDGKLYILGGASLEKKVDITDSLFYVDLKKDFDITKVPWVENDKLPLGTYWSVGAVGGSNNSTIFLFGGIHNSTELLRAYDVKKKHWHSPKTTGIAPQNRIQCSIAVDDKGSFYIIGGAEYVPGRYAIRLFNDIYVFNTKDLTWKPVLTTNQPSLPFFGHTSTLLPDGRIVIIGGAESNSIEGGKTIEADIYKIKIFDLNTSEWKILKATSQTPIEPRFGHSAVLSNDGRIIVYGGIRYGTELAAKPPLIVLDTTKIPFQWSAPDFLSANSVVYHTANLIEDQMIISFGNITSDQNSSSSLIYLLNIRDYSWKANFTSVTQEESKSSGRSEITSPLNIAEIVGSIILIIVVITLVVKLHKQETPPQSAIRKIFNAIV